MKGLERVRDGHLTLLIVPEDERAVRRIRVSYRALRRLGLLGAALAALGGAALVTYGDVIARAGRVALLERENRRLEAESDRVGRIVRNLERAERSYRQIRSLAGLDDLPAAAAADTGATAPPVTVTGAFDGPSAEGPEEPDEPAGAVGTGWPLTIRGFVTADFERPDGHSGIDIAVPEETPVLATAAGTVSQAGFDSILGHYVVIEHEGGFETLYGHNARLLVEAGQRVGRGEAIAFSGNSGRSSAPHLHYEVRREGRALDPSLPVR